MNQLSDPLATQAVSRNEKGIFIPLNLELNILEVLEKNYSLKMLNQILRTLLQRSSGHTPGADMILTERELVRTEFGEGLGGKIHTVDEVAYIVASFLYVESLGTILKSGTDYLLKFEKNVLCVRIDSRTGVEIFGFNRCGGSEFNMGNIVLSVN